MKLATRTSLALLLALSLAIPTAASASAESRSGELRSFEIGNATISGTITYKEEDFPEPPPLYNLDVTVYRLASDTVGPVIVETEDGFSTTRTDALGDYLLTGMPAGEYTIGIRPTAPGAGWQYLGGGASLKTARYFTLSDGGSFSLGDFEITKGGGISGTMISNTGEGLSGWVVVYQGGTRDVQSTMVTSTQVSGGAFHLNRVLTPGAYKVGFVTGGRATLPGGFLATSTAPYMSQWYGGAYNYLAASPVVVFPDHTTSVSAVLQVDPWAIVPDGKYVALGDSYQSGEGAYNYFPETDTELNKCHRSFEAYPAQLASNQLQTLEFDFQACSGALMVHLERAGGEEGVPLDEGNAQLEALDSDTQVVTLGIGGNDLGFASTVQDCIIETLASRVAEEMSGFVLSCADLMNAYVSMKIAWLEEEDGVFRQRLLDVYRKVREKAPNARVVVVTYPSFFPADGTDPELCGWTIRNSDQQWMNAMIRRADTAIARIASSMGFEVVNMVDAFEGHEQCTDHEAMHNAIFLNDGEIAAPESFHPNEYGHRIMADLIGAQLGNKFNPDFTIRPEETVSRKITVGGGVFSVTTGWPGSDVVTSLVSPSGVVYTRENPRTTEHDFGPTWEYYRIENPEHGEWTVNTFGADVAVGGEMVTLTMTDEQPYNVMPTADFTATSVGGTVALDASASTDSDGSIVRYFWDFGDGTSAEGPVAEHTYEIPGAYSVALVTTDNEGGQGFGTDEHVYQIDEPDPDPDPVPGPAVYSAKSLTVTNQFGTTGDAADVYVEGDYTCNSSVAIAGSVYATGDANLTNTCRITGDLLVGGNVKMNSSARVDGSVLAHGSVSIQSSNRIGGDVRAGTTFSTIDGKTNAYLLSHGVIGGVIETLATVPDLPESPAPVFQFAPGDWDGYATVNWKSWMNATAIANNAPSWSQGRTANPGCVMAPWGSSVNGSTVTVTGNTVIDARQASSGCTSVSLQSMTLRVSGDVVLLADSFSGINGLRVESADGGEHTVRLLVSGDQVACASAHTISLSAATLVAPEITLRVMTPGKVVINGTTTLRGSIAAGCVAASGNVKLEYIP